MGKRFKAQSAMEYLMTYGWAILIIAVVLGALFSLGVFSGTSLLGTTCIASPGFLCQNPILSTSGTLIATIGQENGYTIYDAYFYVSPQSSGVNSVGFPTSAHTCSPSGTTLSSGQTVTISCPNVLPSPSPIGTSFSGYIWLRYIISTSGGSATITQKIATVIVKVSATSISSSGGASSSGGSPD